MSALKQENLEQDLLVEYSSRFLHFYRNNKGAFWGILIALLLIIGLVIGFFFYSAQQEEEAQALLATAEEYYRDGALEEALYGSEEDFTTGFTQIADHFGRTKSGNLASYYSAVILAELEEYEEALSYMEQFDLPEGILGVGPLSLHAILLSELDQHIEAGETYIEAAEWHENEVTTPLNLLEAAQSFETAGEYQRALQLLDRILEEYPNSNQQGEVQRLKGYISIRIGASGNG